MTEKTRRVVEAVKTIGAATMDQLVERVKLSRSVKKNYTAVKMVVMSCVKNGYIRRLENGYYEVASNEKPATRKRRRKRTAAKAVATRVPRPTSKVKTMLARIEEALAKLDKSREVLTSMKVALESGNAEVLPLIAALADGDVDLLEVADILRPTGKAS